MVVRIEIKDGIKKDGRRLIQCRTICKSIKLAGTEMEPCHRAHNTGSNQVPPDDPRTEDHSGRHGRIALLIIRKWIIDYGK